MSSLCRSSGVTIESVPDAARLSTTPRLCSVKSGDEDWYCARAGNTCRIRFCFWCSNAHFCPSSGFVVSSFATLTPVAAGQAVHSWDIDSNRCIEGAQSPVAQNEATTFFAGLRSLASGGGTLLLRSDMCSLANIEASVSIRPLLL